MAVNDSTMASNITGVLSNLEYLEFRVVKVLLYVLIFILSCIGNSLVVTVILRAKGKRTPANLLILNLAVCDLVTPALSIPFDLALEELNYVWPFGRATCKVLWPFQTAFSTSSSLTLAVISLDRLRTLANPFAKRVSMETMVMIVCTIHAFSIGLCIPYFISLELNDKEDSCDEDWPSFGHRQAYTVVLFLFQYALPLMTMAVAYSLIHHSLRASTKRLFSTDEQSKRSFKRPSSTISDKNIEFKRKEQNIRLAKMFVLVVVVFAISMFPNQVLWIWVDFGNGANNRFFHYISVACRIFTYANSVLNPFIYALKNKEFRSGYAKIGRTTMKPLRKISNETRKYVRKVSRNAILDSSSPARVKYFAGRDDTLSDLATIVGPANCSESTNISQPAKHRNRKSPCCEIQGVRLSLNLAAGPTRPMLSNNSPVRFSWDGTEPLREIVRRDCLNPRIHGNSETARSFDDARMISEAWKPSALHDVLRELPETNC